MQFQELAQSDREKMIAILTNHLECGARNVLEKGKALYPMLIIHSQENPTINSLQPRSGNTDVDVAYKVAIEMLKKEHFEVAIFSYSTKIGNGDGKFFDALKSVIILESGLAVEFFTLYTKKGLFKKKLEYIQTMTRDVTENVFSDNAI